ncbi:putative tetratricopeptide-like helical domain superfamily [Helianthus anomalus]
MISGCGRNGESEAAFNMFEWMQNENVKPNSTTFNYISYFDKLCSYYFVSFVSQVRRDSVIIVLRNPK